MSVNRKFIQKKLEIEHGSHYCCLRNTHRLIQGGMAARRDKCEIGQHPKINIPTVRPELVEGLPMLRQAQHERHNDMGKLFFGCCLGYNPESQRWRK